MIHRPILPIVLLAVLAIIAGCTPEVTPGVAPGASLPQAASSRQPASETPSAMAPTPSRGLSSLSFWAPDFMSTDPNHPGGVLLNRMLSDFVAASGEPLQVQTQVKARYGKGGLLDYLRTAQPVAPNILPDIIALDAAELEQAVAAGAVHPLDELIDPEVLDGLYPAARALGRIGGRQYAVPFALDIEHVVYDPAVTSNAPETWAGLLAGNTRYLLPLSIPAVRTGSAAGVPPALLSHYLGAEYALDFEERQFELDSEPLLRILSFYDQAVEQGQLDERPEDVAGLQEAKPFYEAGTDAVIQTSARQLVTDWEQHKDLAYAAAPGWSVSSPPIATGWVLAIVTPDPARQQSAAKLLTWLLAPDRNGRWTEATDWLPVSSDGWDFREESPYDDFLDEQLKAAVPLPVGADSSAAALALQQAVLSVVRDGVSPVDAARQALDSIQ
jgi:ABC-type glycerol-3-phosphate transport system substrate-binding protein